MHRMPPATETNAWGLRGWFKRTALALSLGIATTVAIASIGPDAEVWLYRKWTGTTGYPGSVAGVIETREEDWFQSSRLETWTSTEYRRIYLYSPSREAAPSLPEDPRGYLQSLASRRYGRFIPKLVTQNPDSVLANWVAEERGLPFRCVWTWQADQQWSNPAARPLASTTPLIRWSGMAGNIAVWSAAWSVLWLAMIPLRRFRRAHRERLRRERKLCTRCGYPRIGSGGVCPECGDETQHPSSNACTNSS